MLTRADEEVADLIRTYLPKFESTEEVVNAYKMTMSKKLLSNLSIAVKAYLHEFLISRGHTFPPCMHVSNALESLQDEQYPQVPPLNQGNMAMPNPPKGVNANSGQDYRVAAENVQLLELSNAVDNILAILQSADFSPEKASGDYTVPRARATDQARRKEPLATTQVLATSPNFGNTIQRISDSAQARRSCLRYIQPLSLRSNLEDLEI